MALGSATPAMAGRGRWPKARQGSPAAHDPQSGLLSRSGLCAAIDAQFETERGRREGLTVLAVALAPGVPIDEARADMLLQQMAGRLRAGGAAYVARLGGQSFALAHPGLDAEQAVRFGEAVRDRLTLPYQLGAQRVPVGGEAGISQSRVTGYDPALLLSHADMALSVARESPGRGCVSFSPEMEAIFWAEGRLGPAMPGALARGEISLLFGPQASLDDGTIVGVEAALRWLHPELRAVSPRRFIPVAEQTGEIVELGRWMLEEACRAVAGWPAHLKLSVNVSPVQFELTDMVAELKATLARSGLPPHRLDIIVSEGGVLSSARVSGALQRLRDLGVGIVLGEFGTGYSSLSQVGRLPIDKIKIDPDFVRRLPGDEQAGAVVRGITMLSGVLDKIVIAGGIETADQAWMLRTMGCRVGQGYHVGRPRTGAQMRAMLNEAPALDRIAG